MIILLCPYLSWCLALFYDIGLILTSAWISNRIHFEVRDEITYPFIKVNSAWIDK